MLNCHIINFEKKIKTISELTCQIPDIQRDEDIDHVLDIYNYQI